MKKILQTTLLFAGLLFGVFAFGLSAATPAHAACTGSNVAQCISQNCDSKDPLCNGITNGKSGVNSLVQNTTNLLLFVLGAICVIVIIISGIRFATAAGDPGQIKTARESIIYAVAGLVVAILAYAIVHFVLNSLK